MTPHKLIYMKNEWLVKLSEFYEIAVQKSCARLCVLRVILDFCFFI